MAGLPNGAAGLDPDGWLADWTVKDDVGSSLALRTQDNVEAHYKTQVGGSPAWTGASGTFFNVILGGFETLTNLLESVVQSITGVVSGGLSDLTSFFNNMVSTVGDVINHITDLFTAIAQIGQIVTGAIVTPINAAVSEFAAWFTALTGGIGSILESIFLGLTGQHKPGATPADVGNAAAQTAAQANSATSIGELNSQVLAVRNNKSLMSGVDETEESNFLLDSMFTGGAEPAFAVAATSASVPVAYWRASESARKGFISWFGKGQVAELRVDIYKASFDSLTWDLIHTSPNLNLLLGPAWKYVIYNIADELNRIDVEPGDVIGVAWRVVGSGTHFVAGKSAGGWLTDHPQVIPARPASKRTGVGTLSFGSTTYSSEIPWFGIGIITGDIAPPIFAPLTFRMDGIVVGGTYNSVGRTVTFNVPDLMRGGDIFDIVMVGDGGGGSYHAFSPGGGAGKWKGITLIYGVDVPLSTKQFQVMIGPGGDGGINGLPDGDWGLGCSVVIPGWGVVTTQGGKRVGAPGYNGQSAGNFDYNGVRYQGGGQTSQAAQSGVAPGGGGHNAGPIYSDGGAGAPGAVWITVRQGDPRMADTTKPAKPVLELTSATSDTLSLKVGEAA